jgi:solute carrier family 35
MFYSIFRLNGKNHHGDVEGQEEVDINAKPSSYAIVEHEKILSAVFYGLSSLGVIFVNKCILTEYDFPYFNVLATIQFIVTTIILTALILVKVIEIPILTKQICQEVIPISIMFLGNVISGLGSTKSLNLPMLTVLRRFSILMTMVGEWLILNNKASSPVVLSVTLMIGGAIIAAIYDFSFSPSGYFLVLLNNVFTALNGIWLKKASISGKVSKLGVLYYNSLFSAIAMLAYFIAEDFYVWNHAGKSILYSSLSFDRNLLTSLPSPSRAKIMHTLSPELIESASLEGLTTSSLHSTFYNISLYEQWSNVEFIALFLFASCCGSILNYATFLCTSYNSALTTSVIGCLKNVVTSYIGMLLFEDYHFNWLNFLGVNISIVGSLYYTYITLFKGLKGFGAG